MLWASSFRAHSPHRCYGSQGFVAPMLWAQNSEGCSRDKNKRPTLEQGTHERQELRGDHLSPPTTPTTTTTGVVADQLPWPPGHTTRSTGGEGSIAVPPTPTTTTARGGRGEPIGERGGGDPSVSGLGGRKTHDHMYGYLEKTVSKLVLKMDRQPVFDP